MSVAEFLWISLGGLIVGFAIGGFGMWRKRSRLNSLRITRRMRR